MLSCAAFVSFFILSQGRARTSRGALKSANGLDKVHSFASQRVALFLSHLNVRGESLCGSACPRLRSRYGKNELRATSARDHHILSKRPYQTRYSTRYSASVMEFHHFIRSPFSGVARLCDLQRYATFFHLHIIVWCDIFSHTLRTGRGEVRVFRTRERILS